MQVAENHGKPYNYYEDRLIRECGSSLGTREIAERLGRTVSSVRNRAYLLGVSFRKLGSAHHSARYTEEIFSACLALYDGGFKVRRIQQIVRGAEDIPYSTIYDWCESRIRSGISE